MIEFINAQPNLTWFIVAGVFALAYMAISKIGPRDR